MKIREVKTYPLDAALAEPFAYSQAWYDRRGAVLVEIVGDDGLSGWGEAFGPASLTARSSISTSRFSSGAMRLPLSCTAKPSTTGCAITGRKGGRSRP